jgi:hypothetical protein
VFFFVGGFSRQRHRRMGEGAQKGPPLPSQAGGTSRRSCSFLAVGGECARMEEKKDDGTKKEMMMMTRSTKSARGRVDTIK